MQFASVQKLFLVHDFDWQSSSYHSVFARTVQKNSSWKFCFCSLNLWSLGSLPHMRVDKCFWNRFIYLLVNGKKLNVSFSFNWSTSVEHKFEKTVNITSCENGEIFFLMESDVKFCFSFYNLCSTVLNTSFWCMLPHMRAEHFS